MKPAQIMRSKPLDPPSSISKCLKSLKTVQKVDPLLSRLWDDWEKIVGESLSLHCIPINLKNQRVTIGVSELQWSRALNFHRQSLILSFRKQGFNVRDLQVQQYSSSYSLGDRLNQNLTTWQYHPSRIDLHGISSCPACNSFTSQGEIARWGNCSLCQRNKF
uniref:DUF721 domain-containing protein n=1 Tax=Paulinella longichromatophora TaxID=1708747 RepID=A0A2H4ZQG5_9EUKA|nr:hypothetical protein PLO_803 [Paulinella longichromatophora]